jgi:SAM-dependent methyltransferase
VIAEYGGRGHPDPVPDRSEPAPDRFFADHQLAAWYDLFCPWCPDYEFYLGLVMDASAVLDVGSGTGTVLRRARELGHAGRLVGVDPAPGMLAQARAARDDIEWVEGTLGTRLGPEGWQGAFDLVFMSGHAFQVFTTDGQVRANLAAAHTALAPGGRFAFETRNPAARAWERWVPENTREVTDARGRTARMSYQLLSADGEFVEFSHTFSGPWPEPQLSRSRLRFLDVPALDSFLATAGFRAEARYGDFDRSPFTPGHSPEIITIAGHAPGRRSLPPAEE